MKKPFHFVMNIYRPVYETVEEKPGKPKKQVVILSVFAKVLLIADIEADSGNIEPIKARAREFWKEHYPSEIKQIRIYPYEWGAPGKENLIFESNNFKSYAAK